MWSYYGSKTNIVDYYPAPKHGKIIEPFAGSAKYSLKYFDRDVLLVDKYEVIIKIWKWLQKCSPKDILSLPELKAGSNLNDVKFDDPAARMLMGFISSRAQRTPVNIVSPWGETEIIRKKKQIAKNLYKIKHWQVRCWDYQTIKNVPATWFIDPPYEFGGHTYSCSNRKLDFSLLHKWCKERMGQIIVCENTKATWMPFVPFRNGAALKIKHSEAIWTNEPTAYNNEQLKLSLMP